MNRSIPLAGEYASKASKSRLQAREGESHTCPRRSRPRGLRPCPPDERGRPSVDITDLVGYLWSRKCARCFVMDPALWPAKDGSTGITSAKEMDAAEQANKAIKVGSNSFLFF